MRIYFIKHIFMTIVVLMVVIIILALLVHIVPGDPARLFLGQRATPELIAGFRSAMDLDQPAHIQVGRFLWRTLHGDLGIDLWTKRSITATIGDVLPHTIILAWSSLLLAVVVGIPLGVFSASHPDSWIDRLTAIISISFITIPNYVGGLIMLLIFAVQLKVLPAMGVGEASNPIDYLRHLVMPSVALAIPWVGYLARLVRTSLLEVFNADYIRAARAAGLKEHLILYKYALKNALIPTMAVLGVGIGNLMGGAVFVEVIFNRPGMGTLIFKAIQMR
ncbi:MAG: peptide ABC transporter permease, partial [Chloroflexi bacterium RBG_19FT_COMBO_47_9]